MTVITGLNLTYGMFSVWTIAVNNAMYTLARGDEPVIWLGPGSSYWAEQRIRFIPDIVGYYGNLGNAWDYYFEPVSKTQVLYTGDQHVIIANGPLAGMVIRYGQSNKAVKWGYRAQASPYFGMDDGTRLVGLDVEGDFDQSLLTPEYRKKVHAFIQERIQPLAYLRSKMQVLRSLIGNKCLGIHYRNLRHNQIDLRDYFTRVDRLLASGDYERMFLATDSENVRRQFEARYPSVLCCNHVRRDDGNDVHCSDTAGPKIGEQVLLDVYTLAACKHVVVGRSNVTWALFYLNPDLTWTYIYGPRDITQT